MDFATVNFWSVLASAIAAMIIGMIWYSQKVFGKTWIELSEINKEKLAKANQKNMTPVILGGLVSNLVIAYVLAHLLIFTDSVSIGEGITMAFWLWLGFVATVSLGSVLWEKKSIKLWILNNAYNLLIMIVMAIILVSWK